MLDPSVFNIIYFVALANEEVMDQTRYQGFTLGNYDARHYIYKIIALPQNLLELKSSKVETVRARAMGITNINLVPIEERFLVTALTLVPSAFNVVYSLASTHDIVAAVLDKIERPILHVSAIPKDGAISVTDLHFRSIWAFCNSVKDYLGQQSLELRDLFVEIMGKERKWSTDVCNLKAKLHMLTRPNEVLLKSFDYGVKNGQPLRPNLTDEDYIESVFAAAKEVMTIQHSVLGKDLNSAKVGLILTSFGMLKHRYNVSKPIKSHDENAELKREIAKAEKIFGPIAQTKAA